MENNHQNDTRSDLNNWNQWAVTYLADAFERSILFMDVMRRRGNIYLKHAQEGMPPVLTFDYEIIMDGRDMDPPVNYALSRIIPPKGTRIDPLKRPVIVIDPRAGHGPGIGGSKQDSEIGMAMKNGHPAYFVLFFPDPMPGQTLADVEQAQVKFVEHVRHLHPDAEEPTVIGNCQAGWAVALLGSDRPDLTGPLVLNGSPMSYWAGEDQSNFMRYRGGLLGGVWLASLMSDFGNGKYDGANLVMNFEDMNPANTYWTKQYNLYSKIDTEAQRYLNFEKWWNGYFLMTGEEIHFIVSNLFVGNKLEQGELELTKDKTIDLKNLEDPMVVFASRGDNITPPQQALNWIAKVYGSVEEIRRQGQVIIYRVHDKIGHLGIFVSASVARKEHREIISSMDMIEYLSPGLYEMIIEEVPTDQGITDFRVKYEPRDIDDILSMDDGLEDEDDFPSVAAISEINDHIYRTVARPWVRMLTTESSAELLRQLHPMRFTRYAFSDLNPLMMYYAMAAPFVETRRTRVSEDNPFLHAEQAFSKSMITMLDWYRDMRDLSSEFVFKMIYGNQWVRDMFSNREKVETDKLAAQVQVTADELARARDEKEKLMTMMESGGFVEGVVRIIIAVIYSDQSVDRMEFKVSEEIIRQHPSLRRLKPHRFKKMVKEQSAILWADQERAINALSALIRTPEEQKEALEIAMEVVNADNHIAGEELAVIDKIKAAFENQAAAA